MLSRLIEAGDVPCGFRRWLPVLVLFIHGCGGSGSNSVAAPDPAPGIPVQGPAQVQSQAADATIVSQVPLLAGNLTLYSDGTAILTRDSWKSNVTPTGSTRIQAIAGISGGVQVQFANGRVYFSPDGTNLAGGGRTVELPYFHVIASNAQFGPRDSARGIEFANQLWLSGGYNNLTESYYDIWYSGDHGANWTLGSGSATPTATAPTDFYDAYSPIVSDGTSLFAIGSRVWKSTDGKQWTVISGAGPQTATDDFSAFFRNGQFIYFETQNGNLFTSTDAINWNYFPGFLPMRGRCGAAAFQALDKYWVAGGGDCFYGNVLNDIWNSADGVNWSQVMSGNAPKLAEWSGRLWPCVASTGTGTIWLFGGYTTEAGGEDFDDLWFSHDGITWKSLEIGGNETDQQTRHAPTCFFRADTNTLLIVAGKGSVSADNDLASVSNTVLAIDLPLDSFLP